LYIFVNFSFIFVHFSFAGFFIDVDKYKCDGFLKQPVIFFDVIDHPDKKLMVDYPTRCPRTDCSFHGTKNETAAHLEGLCGGDMLNNKRELLEVVPDGFLHLPRLKRQHPKGKRSGTNYKMFGGDLESIYS